MGGDVVTVALLTVAAGAMFLGGYNASETNGVTVGWLAEHVMMRNAHTRSDLGAALRASCERLVGRGVLRRTAPLGTTGYVLADETVLTLMRSGLIR